MIKIASQMWYMYTYTNGSNVCICNQNDWSMKIPLEYNGFGLLFHLKTLLNLFTSQSSYYQFEKVKLFLSTDDKDNNNNTVSEHLYPDKLKGEKDSQREQNRIWLCDVRKTHNVQIKTLWERTNIEHERRNVYRTLNYTTVADWRRTVRWNDTILTCRLRAPSFKLYKQSCDQMDTHNRKLISTMSTSRRKTNGKLKLVRTPLNVLLHGLWNYLSLSICTIIPRMDSMLDFICMGPVNLPEARRKRKNTKWKSLDVVTSLDSHRTVFTFRS